MLGEFLRFSQVARGLVGARVDSVAVEIFHLVDHRPDHTRRRDHAPRPWARRRPSRPSCGRVLPSWQYLRHLRDEVGFEPGSHLHHGGAGVPTDRFCELLKELARTQPSERAEKANAVQGRSSQRATNVEASPYSTALESNGMSRQTAHRFQALAAEHRLPSRRV
jgi:hypothetical protein